MLTDFGGIAHRAAGIVGEVSAERIAALCQSCQKNFSVRICFVQRPGGTETAEAIHSRQLLSEESARSGNGRTREQPDKFTSAHVFPRSCRGRSYRQNSMYGMAMSALGQSRHRDTYSITSSARESSEGGTVRPSALAVLRLIASWYLVAA